MANELFEYDVVLSFAGEDKEVVQKLTGLLRAKNRKILLDEYRAAELGGSDFITHLAELYRTKARCCVLFFSKHYPLRKWTEAERTSVRQHALRDASEDILVVQLDDSEAPGSKDLKQDRTLRQPSMEEIINWLEEKLTETIDRSGPPSQSHDLRSGNVPSDQDHR